MWYLIGSFIFLAIVALVRRPSVPTSGTGPGNELCRCVGADHRRLGPP